MIMGFKSCKSCFVCDSEDLQGSIYLTTEKTLFTNTDFPTKIWQLIGESFLVIVDPSDQLCNNCTLLINKSDKLETRLVEIKTQITHNLSTKYNLDNEIDDDCSIPDCSIPNDFELSKEDSECQISIAIDDSDRSGNCSDPIFQNGEKISNQKNQYNEFSNSGKTYESNMNIKKEPTNCTCPEECIGSNNQHECLNLSLSPCSVDLVPSDSISHEQALKSDVFDGMEADHALGKDIGEIKKELYVNYTPDQSPPISLSEEISQPESCELNFDSITPNVESNSLDTYTLDMKIPENSKTLVTKQEKNTQGCEGFGLNLNVSVSDFNFTKLETPKLKIRKQVVRKKRNRVFNGYQRKKLRPILPKLTNVLHSYCVLDLDARHDNLIQPANNSFLTNKSGTITMTQPSYTTTNTNFTNKTDIKPTEHNEVTSEIDQSNTIDEFQCRVCSLRFDDLKSLKSHKKVHGKTINSHECSICQRVYKTRSGLQNHQATHTGKYAFYCEVCGLGFMSRWALQEHSGSHTKESRYVCDICGKKFSFQSSHWIHKKWHENPLPYKCNECGRLFKHSSMLANHRRSKHSGERPYKCSFCPASFVVSNSLRRHEILHTKKYPFTCEKCQQGFTTRFKYSEHLAKAHRIIIDKAPVDKKDFKVAVQSEETEGKVPEQSLVIDLMTPELSMKDADDLISNLPVEFSDNIVRIFGQYF